MTRRVGKCGRMLRPQPWPQGFYQSVHAATTGLWLNLTHSEASSSNTSAASWHGLGPGLPAQGQITALFPSAEQEVLLSYSTSPHRNTAVCKATDMMTKPVCWIILHSVSLANVLRREIGSCKHLQLCFFVLNKPDPVSLYPDQLVKLVWNIWSGGSL